ncbi:MAG TPA: tetratricopeptide repeat protein [Candidatus Eisenbacteria bacterium]|nr:tetratricopeptide repeat protein [Candidatus Eisenbacteria bacterium]
MKKYISVVMLLGLLLALGAMPVVAQVTGIHGVCKDQEGKFITDGAIEVTNTDSGRKLSAKTDKNGEYHMIGLTPGSYNVTLTRNGRQIDAVSKVPIGVGDNPAVDFDLKKDLAQAGPTEEQLRKQQEVQKQNEKIKGLNARLAEARDLEKAGNYDQAVTILQEATTADPSKDLLWAYLADAYRGAKKYPEAIEAYQKALAINPNSGAYHNGMADAYAKSGQTEKAVAEYTAAAQAEPANAATYYFNEGAIFTNTGKIDDAITAFDKVIQLDPNRADAYYWKGVNMMGKATTGKDGKFVAAPGTAECFQKYLELKPDGPLAQNSKDMLASIGSAVETTYGKQKAPSKKKP